MKIIGKDKNGWPIEEGYVDQTVPEGKCDCGANAVGSSRHSDWCSGVKGRTMFQNQPEIEFPQELRDAGFEDYSDSHSVGAEAFHPQKRLSVYVHPERPEDRELADLARYVVFKGDDEYMDSPVFETEDLMELLKFLRAEG